MSRSSLRTFAKVLPWALALLLALVVWHDRARGLAPWFVALGLSFSCGWMARGPRRSYRRAAAPSPRTMFVRAPPQRVQVVTVQAPPPRVEFVSMPAPRSPIREVQATVDASPALVADLSSILVNMGYRVGQAKLAAKATVAKLGSGAEMDALIREALKTFRVGGGAATVVRPESGHALQAVMESLDQPAFEVGT